MTGQIPPRRIPPAAAPELWAPSQPDPERRGTGEPLTISVWGLCTVLLWALSAAFVGFLAGIAWSKWGAALHSCVATLLLGA